MNFSKKSVLSMAVSLVFFSLGHSAMSSHEQDTPSPSRPLSLTFDPQSLPLSDFLKATEELRYNNPLEEAMDVQKMCRSGGRYFAPEELKIIKTVLQKIQENRTKSSSNQNSEIEDWDAILKTAPLSTFLKATEDLNDENPLKTAFFILKMGRSTIAHLAPEELKIIRAVVEKIQETLAK